MNEQNSPALVGQVQRPVRPDVAEALRLATKMMRDSWATGNDAAWQPGYQALEAHLSEMLAAERERIAQHFDARDKGPDGKPLGIGFYDPHEPAEIIRSLGGA